MEKEQIKGKDSGNAPQASEDKIRTLERHPEVLGCMEQLALLPFVAAQVRHEKGKYGATTYDNLDIDGFVSKCPEFIDVRTLPKGNGNHR